MDIGKEFATDSKLEQDGVWVDLDDETSILIARMNNKKYRNALRRVLKPYKTQISAGTIQPGKLDDLLVTPLAAHVLLDWKGLTVNGEPTEYSREAAERVMQQFPDFRELVVTLASDMDLFRTADIEDDTKN